jgi:hypothetical protein
MGQNRDGDEEEDTHEPSGSLEGVRKTKNTSADDSDEDVGEGLKLAGEGRSLAEKRRVLSGRWRYFKGIRGGASFVLKTHLMIFDRISEIEEDGDGYWRMATAR